MPRGIVAAHVFFLVAIVVFFVDLIFGGRRRGRLDRRLGLAGCRSRAGQHGDRAEPGLPAWATELIRTTKNLNFTVTVTSAERGTAPRAATVAAETVLALARETPGGLGNFHFAAAASIPRGAGQERARLRGDAAVPHGVTQSPVLAIIVGVRDL